MMRRYLVTELDIAGDSTDCVSLILTLEKVSGRWCTCLQVGMLVRALFAAGLFQTTSCQEDRHGRVTKHSIQPCPGLPSSLKDDAQNNH